MRVNWFELNQQLYANNAGFFLKLVLYFLFHDTTLLC